MERIPPLVHWKRRGLKLLVALATTVALLASILVISPAAATDIPSGSIFPSVFDPLDSTWKNGQPKGYSEGEVAVIETELRAGASAVGDTWDVAVCLDYFTGSTYFFLDFQEWDTTHQPALLSDGTAVASLSDETVGFITFLYPAGSTLTITSVSSVYVQQSTSADEAICVDVSYTYDGNDDVYLLTGGYIAKTGDVAPYTAREAGDPAPAVVVPDGGTVVNGASTTSGTFKVRLSGTGEKTINFKGTDFAPAQPLLTLIKEVDNTGGGTDAATEWLLSATLAGELAPALSGYTDDNGSSDPTLGVSGAVDAGIYTLAEVADPTVDGDYLASWDCGPTPVNGANEIELAAGEDVTCTVTNTYAALSIDKSIVTDPAPVDGYDVGDVITYEITVSNPTNATLTGVSVSDSLLTDLDCDPITAGNQVAGFTLPPAAELTCTGTYTVQQSDMDADGGGDGDIDNTATADSAETGEVTDSAEAPLDRNPSIVIVKDGSANVVDGEPGLIVEGDSAEFEITVTNNGNVSLNDVVVDDAFAAACDRTWAEIMLLNNNDVVVTPVGSSLEPEESFTYTCTATADEVSTNAAGDTFTNTAEVDGSDPDGAVVEDSDSEDVTIVSPGVLLSKSASVTDSEGEPKDPANTVTEAGDLVVYTVTATNTGDVVLTGVSVTDPMVALTCDWPGAVGVLAVDDDPGTLDVVENQVVCTGTYTVLQSDLDDNGGGDADIDNTAGVTSDQGAEDEASASVPLQQDASIDIAKYHDLNLDGTEDDTQVLVSGATAEWTIVVTNDGNVSLTGVSVADPEAPFCAIGWGDVMTTVNTDGVPVGDSLEPGESFSYECTLAAVTGDFTNTASATATEDPVGDSDTSEVDVIDPEITITKMAPNDTLVDGDTAEVDLEFTINVANTGDVDLTDVVLIDLAATVDCDPVTDGDQPIPTTLAVGADVDCTATVTVTPNPDGTWPSTDNSASVSATADAEVDGGNPDVSDDDDATAHIVGITVAKTVVELDDVGDPIGDPAEELTVAGGSDIRWVIEVTNIGSKSVEFDLTDPLATGCERTDVALAAGDSTTITCDVFGITDDVDPNTATVSATPDGAQDPLPAIDDTASVDVVSPSIEIMKSVEGPIGVTPDDESVEVTYTIVVRNTGDVDLTGVTVTDPAADSVDCGGGDGTVGTLAADDGVDGGPDEAACTATKIVTPDVDGIWSAAGNTATVCGESPVGDPADPTDDVCDDDSTIADFAGIRVVKEVGPTADGPWSDSYDAAVGDTVYWRVVVTNIGSVDLIDVEVKDPHNTGCEAVIGVLAAGETEIVTCSETAQYSDTGVTNTATATGCVEADPTGLCVDEVSDEDGAVYSALYNGFTPGFWKNHAKGKHNMFKGQLLCGSVETSTDTTFGEVFGVAVDGITVELWEGKGRKSKIVEKDLADLSIYDALSYQGGSEVAGATEILLRAAAASTLNACFHLTLGNEIGEVDDVWPITLEALGDELAAALSSPNRQTILELAAKYDGWNNGLHEIDWSDW